MTMRPLSIYTIYGWSCALRSNVL